MHDNQTWGYYCRKNYVYFYTKNVCDNMYTRIFCLFQIQRKKSCCVNASVGRQSVFCLKREKKVVGLCLRVCLVVVLLL